MADPAWLYIQLADFHCYLPGASIAGFGRKLLNSMSGWARVQKYNTNIMAYPDILIWHLTSHVKLTSAM